MTTKIVMRERFAFSAAHHLPTFPEGHKCRRVHGHTWEVVVDVEADERASESGYAIDHALLRRVCWEEIGRLDHRMINDIEGIERGLAEDILAWMVERLTDAIEGALGLAIARIELIEHSSSEGAPVAHSKVWQRAA